MSGWIINVMYLQNKKNIIASIERGKERKGVKNGPGIQAKITNSLSRVRKVHTEDRDIRRPG